MHVDCYTVARFFSVKFFNFLQVLKPVIEEIVREDDFAYLGANIYVYSREYICMI